MVTSDVNGLCLRLARDDKITETDIAIVVAWFILETKGVASVSVSEVSKFISDRHVRPQVNGSRLKARLKARRDVSITASGEIAVPLRTRSALHSGYGSFLAPAMATVVDSILVRDEFALERPYVRRLVEEINGCRQYNFLDGCAVLMRRLMEVLVIEAYEKVDRGTSIRGPDGYFPLSSLIGEITSGKDFRLSRSSPRALERCKAIGDTAAHSRNYITKAIDIDEYSAEYRRLIDELRHLEPKS